MNSYLLGESLQQKNHLFKIPGILSNKYSDIEIYYYEVIKLSDKNWITKLFASIDDKNTEKFLSFLSEDCCFRFGNIPAVQGTEAIGGFVGGFFESIASLKHEIAESWDIPGGVICHGTVTYTRHDNSVLTVFFSNIFKTKNDKVYDYLIFADTSALYAQ